MTIYCNGHFSPQLQGEAFPCLEMKWGKDELLPRAHVCLESFPLCGSNCIKEASH